MKPTEKRSVLTTAMVKTMNIRFQSGVAIQLGSTTVNHTALVADIAEDVILGLNLLENSYIKLYLGNGTMPVMGQHKLNSSYLLTWSNCGVVVLVEPENQDLTVKGMLVEGNILNAGNKIIHHTYMLFRWMIMILKNVFLNRFRIFIQQHALHKNI